MNMTLGNRMKENYEARSKTKLLRRTPVILRLDGKTFHTVTRGCDKPFDSYLSYCMSTVTYYLVNNIQGAKLAYTQSDEISILLTDYDNINTDAWFDYQVQKMCCVAAGMASALFSQLWNDRHYVRDQGEPSIIVLDCRAFNLPKEEVVNYFIWRQKDWIRNSVQMVAQANFSHKVLQGKKIPDIHEMLYGKGINWATDFSNRNKNGATFWKSNREFVEDHSFIYTDDESRESINDNILYPSEGV